MKEVFFVTGNPCKVISANELFFDYEIMANIIDLKTEEPDVNDIEFIAKTKVEKAYEVLNKPCIANDSGFYIEAYPDELNFPGAFVNRKLLVPIGINGLLEKMEGIENRNCYFEDVVAFYDGTELKFFHAISKGILTDKVRGGFKEAQWSPLWQVFIPEGYDITLSELTEDERKKRNQGRESALKQFAKWYSEILKMRL